MSVLQNTVLTTFKAETASYVAAVKTMRGVERDEAKKTLATLEQQNAKLTDQLAVLGKATAAIAAVTITWKAAQAAASAYLEDVRLESAAAGADINRLRDATRGLVETDNLLMFAGKAMHGVWKLTQQEMEVVAKGTRVLAKDMGVDLQSAMEKVTEAVSKGTTGSLKELGLEVKNETELMEAMTEAGKRWGATGLDEGEKWQQASVQMADAWDDLKGALGAMVIALAPVVEMIAKLVTDIVQLVKMPFALGAEAADASKGVWVGAVREAMGFDDAPAGRQPKAWGGSNIVGGLAQGYHQIYGAARELGARALAETAEEIAALKKRGGRRGARGTTPAGADPWAFVGDMASASRAFGEAGMATFGAYQDAGAQLRADATASREQGSTIRFRDEMAAIREDWETWYPELAAQMEAMRNEPTVLERLFGKPDDITALVVALDVARAAVDTFGQAGAAAMGAWITGEQSMGDAIKGVLAQSLTALAMESTVKALFHVAAAAGNAAFGNFASAGMHLKAAGLYGAVAVAAGVGAKAAHSAGWASGGRTASVGAGSALGGGGGDFRSGGAEQGGGNRQVVVMLGRDFGMFTDLEQRQLINQAIRQADDDGGTKHVRFR